MKKIVSIFIFFSTIYVSLYAQKSDQSIFENNRDNRHFAITAESGIRSLTGLGISLSYYKTNHLAFDLGVGTGFQGFKGGLRGRYLFLDKNFTPYVGASLIHNPRNINDTPFPSIDDGSSIIIDVKKSTYGQLIAGFEYMGDRGFVIGFNLGYSHNFNARAWTTNDNLSLNDTNFLDFAFGSGISTGLNIGYAFD